MQARKSWQKQLSEGIADPIALFKLLEIDSEHLAAVATQPFALKVPESFVRRMKKGDFHDPLLRQVLPLLEESVAIPGFSQDPLQEKKYNPLPGLIHKYESRILLTLTGACAIHCRYCFRRYFPYEENNPNNLPDVIDYIQQHPQVEEVILSGGDPLVVPDRTLAKWIKALESLPQITTLRLHTRLPIVLPDRITPELIQLLSTTRLQVVVVVHCNHPQEIDPEVIDVLLQLNQAGVTVLNQAVLLKDINDNVPALVELSKKLFNAKALPYYLYLLDKVSGTHHFEVSEEKAQELWRELLAKLPGYLVPRLAREEPGQISKTWLTLE